MKKILVIIGFLSMSAMAQDKGMNCDSTCIGQALGAQTSTVPLVQEMPKAQTVYGSNTVAMPGTTSTSSTKVTYGTCPAGFTYFGDTQYPKSQQTTITYYVGGQATGTKVMPSQDLDNDCTKVEYQSLQCPAGQTGTITQSRTVSTGDTGYEYQAWYTVSNTCQASNGAWTWLGWQYSRKNNPSPYPQCDYYTLRPNASCSPIGYKCAYDDDLTTKQGTYSCNNY